MCGMLSRLAKSRPSRRGGQIVPKGTVAGPGVLGTVAPSLSPCLTPTLGDDNPEREWAKPKPADSRHLWPALRCLEEVASVGPSASLRRLQVSEL